MYSLIRIITLVLFLTVGFNCNNNDQPKLEESDEFTSGYFVYSFSQGKTTDLFRSNKVVSVKFKNHVSPDMAKSLISEHGLELFEEYYQHYGKHYRISSNWNELLNHDYIIMSVSDHSELPDFITSYPKSDSSDSFGNHPDVEFCLPSYSRYNYDILDKRLFIGKEFLVSTRSDSSVIAEYCSKRFIEIKKIKSTSNHEGEIFFFKYLLSITDNSTGNSLEMSNLFTEEDVFLHGYPFFYNSSPSFLVILNVYL